MDRYYPSDTIATDRGIVRSWVLKMILLGEELTAALPFTKVLVHGTVVDESGRKMSKSLENGIDPVSLIDRFGSDSVRLGLALMSSEDGDLSLSEAKFDLAHNLVTKVWNVARFALQKLKDHDVSDPAEIGLAIEDEWILSRLTGLADSWSRGMESLQIGEVGKELVDFVWHALSDWYIEAVRFRFASKTPDAGCALWVLLDVMKRILWLLEPFTPFLCEELWQKFHWEKLPHADFPIPMESGEPDPLEYEISGDSEKVMDFLQEVVRAVRKVRITNKIPAERKLRIEIRPHDRAETETLKGGVELVRNLAGASEVTISDDDLKSPGYAAAVTRSASVFVELSENLDFKAEIERVTAARREVQERFISVTRRIESLDFIKKAPADVVAEMKRLKKNLSRQIAVLLKNEEELNATGRRREAASPDSPDSEPSVPVKGPEPS
jgi:valyl-tRNA synthetase